MYRIAILASTNGTDFQAILDEQSQGLLEGIEIVGLFTNILTCGAAQKAHHANIPVFSFSAKGKTREAFDTEMLDILQAYKVDLICLIGYMRIISPLLIEAFPHRIINVHPSLIPAFSGPGAMDMNVHAQVVASGVQITGCTFHIVTEEVDEGPILLQKSCEVCFEDTPDSVKHKVQNLEKKYYPALIRAFARGDIVIDGKRTKMSCEL